MPRRTAIVWAAFALLFVTGPPPWRHPPGPGRHAAAGSAQIDAAAAIRRRAESAFTAGQPGDAAALLAGMTLGDDSGLSAQAKREFRTASLTHIVAASGQNIALLLALVLPLLAWLGLGLKARLLIGTAVVGAYVPLAGGEAPIRRAAVMAMVLIAAKLRGRAADGWHALGVAGLITLALDRASSSSLGWQLSFAAVGAMLSLGSRLQRWLARMGLPLPVAEAAGMTVAATAATSPLIAWRVGRLSLTGIPANLVAAPAVAPAMWIGMVTAAAGQISHTAAVPLAWLASVPAAAILETARIFSTPSWSAVGWRPPGLVAALTVAVVVAAGLVGRPGRTPA